MVAWSEATLACAAGNIICIWTILYAVIGALGIRQLRCEDAFIGGARSILDMVPLILGDAN